MKTINQVFSEWESVGVVTPRTQVEVGKKYLCLVSRNAWGLDKPLIPFLHADPEIGANGAALHYHLDSRFLSMAHLNALSVDPNRYTHGRSASIVVANFGAELDVKMMECKRVDPTGIQLCTPFDFNKWAEKYTGKSCKWKRCPHWGMPMVDRKNGLLECPMHGLFGSSTTERIVSRMHATITMAGGDPCEL